MTDANLAFCRLMLAALVEEFRQDWPSIGTKRDGWVINAGFRGHWEFHGTGPAKDFYWHGHADNAYDARYKGWSAWAKQQKGKIKSEWQALPAGGYHMELAKGWARKDYPRDWPRGYRHKILERTRGMARRRLVETVVKCECAECTSK